jgi:pimeloyl-ACP methyl ester carboxylesterase
MDGRASVSTGMRQEVCPSRAAGPRATIRPAMQPLVEHRMQVAGFGTRALELEGDGPPLVLLHGFADSADSWRLVLDRLARRGRRAIALDLPGYATADPLHPKGAVLPQLDAFARAALEHVADEAGEPAVLMGNSLGGCVALRAGQDPEAPLRAVVPVAPAGFDHPAWFRLIEAQPLLRAVLAAPVPVPSTVVRAVVGEAYRQLAFARPRAVAGEVVASFTAHHATRAMLAGHLASGRRLLPEIGGGICFELERITVPVHLVWGSRDRMVAHRGSRHLLEALPDTTYELLDGVGHCPQVEAPGRLLDSVERFLAAAPAV